MTKRFAELSLLLVLLIGVPHFAHAQKKTFSRNSVDELSIINRRRLSDPHTAARRRAELERVMSLVSKGTALDGKGDKKGAIVALRKTIQLYPAFGMGYVRLAHVYCQLGQWKDAAATYRVLMYDAKGKKWGSSLSNDYDHLIDFTFILQQAGALTEAKSVYRKACRMAPEKAQRYLYRYTSDKDFDVKTMAASVYLARADKACFDSRVNSKEKKADYIKKWSANINKALAVAPAYAPAHLMKAEELEHRSQHISFYGDKKKGESVKREAFQAYNRAALLGNNDTRTRADKAMKSYWYSNLAANAL